MHAASALFLIAGASACCGSVVLLAFNFVNKPILVVIRGVVNIRL